MPFDPKLILPEEPPLTPEGELQLPDELAALAEQLTEDARFLATRYPAVRERAAVSLASGGREMPPSHRFAQVAVLVGSTLATLLLAVVIARQTGTDGNAGPISAAVPAPVERTGPPESAASATSGPAATLSIPAGGPTISLTDLSGPELEAVFDLWQRGEGDGSTGIAF